MNIKLKKYISKDQMIRWSAVLLFGIIVALISWQSDDAYHAYIMAKHLVEGKGFVYNVGYRVSASTCPLFTLVVALLYALSGHMFFSGILAGILFSVGAAYIIFMKLCDKICCVAIAFITMVMCYCFMCYTTSGLENSLLYFLGTLFVYLFWKKTQFEPLDLFFLALLLSLIAMTRMDAVLLFIPLICWGYLFKTKQRMWRRILIGLLGLSPFMAWEIFSVIYYGYPFPNTLYVKMYTGFPEKEYIIRGIDFLYRSYSCDLLLLLIPLVFIGIAIYFHESDYVLLAIGIILYTGYVISIGGDFMLGRHLTMQFILGLTGILWIIKNTESKKLCSHIFICICIIGILWKFSISPYYYDRLLVGNTPGTLIDASGNTGVLDEKGWYYEYTGTIPYMKGLQSGRNLPMEYVESTLNEIEDAHSSGHSGCRVFMLQGIAAYYASYTADLYLTDSFGLMDPLLSHLPAEHTDSWRVGHMYRAIPDGYTSSVMSGNNQIKDKGLHEYYDKILTIINGDIWSAERLETIIKMNLGKYDHLLENYINTLSLH